MKSLTARIRTRLTAATLLAALTLALGWSLLAAAQAAFDPTAWRALADDPQTLPALALSLWTGLLSTTLALAGTAWILSTSFGRPAWKTLTRWISPILAVPHAAFAIGLLALLSPSGWVLRVLSPWATGLDAPPAWSTTQDPWGLALVLALTLKEIPFLLWTAHAHLQRPDVARRLQQELQLSHTMGYAIQTAWWRVAWPQVMARLSAPLLAVLTYSLTVVDMALVIGPATPPTLAVLAWQWLQDADAARTAQGVAAAWLLAGCVAACALAFWLLRRLPVWRARRTRGVPPLAQPNSALPTPSGAVARALLLAVYAATVGALGLGSVWGYWPFPQVLPDSLAWSAWVSVLQSTTALWTTLWLALLSACVALAWTVAWLELAPAPWRRNATTWIYLPLLLPTVLWVVGLHQLTLAWGLDGSVAGVWFAHTLAAIPFAVIALSGPYASFDERLGQVAASLGRGRWGFLWRVKWPLLRAALASAFAVGFAVSVAQYLPTLYIGAGRFATVTTEAIASSAGGQRSMAAAYAWLQWLLPVMVFGLAGAVGRPRRFPTMRMDAPPAGHNNPA